MRATTRQLGATATLFAIISLVLLGVSVKLATHSPPAWEFLAWGLAIAGVDLWSDRFSKRVHWSYGSAIIAAPLVLSADGTAPLLGLTLGAVGAITETDLKRPSLIRVTANAGQLAIAGFASGMVYELLRPPWAGPSVWLLLVVAIAAIANVIVNAGAVALATRKAYGPASSDGILIAALTLGFRKVVASVAVAATASTVALLGPGWMVFAAVQIAALGAIPIVRSRLEARRRDIMATVTAALNARGVVGTAHDHLEETAVILGHRLGVSGDQIEQLRYLALLYAMTDHFAGTLPRSFEDQLRGLKENEFSSALLLGLPLNDIADARVVRIAEAAAEYESLVRPIDGGTPLSSKEAAADLLRSGARPEIVAALLDERPLSTTYLKAWELDPTSPWRRPMRWIAGRVAS